MAPQYKETEEEHGGITSFLLENSMVMMVRAGTESTEVGVVF
jgi:hypothetical protein